MENHIIGRLHVGMLHLQQQGEQVSRSDHQDITDAMHKHRIQNAAALLVHNTAHGPHGKSIE
jgi:hypothetical protein